MIVEVQCLSLTDSLTPSRLVNLMPVNDDAVFLHLIGKGRQTHQLALLHIY